MLQDGFGTLVGKTVGDRARETALLSCLHPTYQRALSAGDKLESRTPLENCFSTQAPRLRSTGMIVIVYGSARS
jgi:hypothetical protein